MQFTVNLTAGVRSIQQTRGRFFLLLDTGAADSVELALMDGTRELERIRTASRGFSARVSGNGFTHVELRSSVSTALEIVISEGIVEFDFFAGARVSATIENPLPLPVSNDRGAPASPIYVAGITDLSDAPATGMTNGAAVAVTDAGAVVLAADATRKAARFCNIGAAPVALGAAGITWAARCIVLNPGDVWIEERAANLAWSAITAAGTAASVTAQGVNA